MSNGFDNQTDKSSASRHRSDDRIIATTDHKPSADRGRWLTSLRLGSAFSQIFALLLTIYFIVYNSVNKTVFRLILFLTFKATKEMDDENNDDLSYLSALARQRQHHKKSFEIISQALKIDERIDDKNIGIEQ